MPVLQKREWTEEEKKQFVETAAKLQFNVANSIVEPVISAQKRFSEILNGAAFSSNLLKSINILQNLPRFELPKLDYLESRYMPTLIPPRPRSEYLLEEQNYLLKKLINQNKEKKPFEYLPKSKTLILHYPVRGAINLNTKNDSNNMSTLFEIFYEFLTKRGVIKGGYRRVCVTREEIINRAIQKGKSNVDANWIKHTRSNLVSYKIPLELDNTVQISEYKKGIKGYEFMILVEI